MRSTHHINPTLKINAEPCWQNSPQQPFGLKVVSRLFAAGGVLRAPLRHVFSCVSVKQEQKISLASQQLWSGVFRAPTRVLCRSGNIWITQTGNGEDYILRAGQEFVASPQSQTIISTFGTAASFELHATERNAFKPVPAARAESG
jgi:hypothetical protein